MNDLVRRLITLLHESTAKLISFKLLNYSSLNFFTGIKFDPLCTALSTVYYSKVLLSRSFCLNGHAMGFYLQPHKLEQSILTAY